MDCENCRHLTVVGLHDTGPRYQELDTWPSYQRGFHVVFLLPPTIHLDVTSGLGVTYLCPSLPVEHRPSTTPRHRTLFSAALVIPDHFGSLLFQLCFSVSPPTVARLTSLPLPLRVPGQGLACGAGCWLPEGVSDPAPRPPSICLATGSCSLPQIFISDLLLPLDFVDAPQTGVEECLDLSLHRLCWPPCLTSVKQY